MSQKTIDIIIPAWKAQKTIVRTLASIVEQTIADQCIVTIINDADGVGYADIVNHYSKYLDIRELTLETNRGPGIARQYGIDNTSCEYIAFCDADDTLYGPYALETMFVKTKEFPNSALIIGEFVASKISPHLHFIEYACNYVWAFAKLYKRSFIEKYEIKFPDSRSNEDVAFNRLIELLAIDEKVRPVMVERVVYCWTDTPGSITRSTNDFTYGPNIIGYIDNISYALTHARNRGVSNNLFINHKIIDTMVAIYAFLMESIEHAPHFREQNFKKALEFYDKHYQLLEYIMGTDILKARSIKCLKGYTGNLGDFIPEMTFTQFMNYLRNTSVGDYKLP